MATQWIVAELWEEQDREEIERTFATKSGAENWVRITMMGEKIPYNIYIEERPVVRTAGLVWTEEFGVFSTKSGAEIRVSITVMGVKCYHCKATVGLVWTEGYGGVHMCEFCKALDDNACGMCDKQSDGTFQKGEGGFLRCPECEHD